MTDRQYEVLVYLVIGTTIISYCIYFHSVWIRGGYTGKDKILDLFEVNRVYIHAGGALVLLMFEVMAFSLKQYPWPAWTIVGTILGAIYGVEMYLDGKKVTDRIKKYSHRNEETKEDNA